MNYEDREEWFKWYCQQIEKEKPRAKFHGKFLCPCCYMPTLTRNGGWDTCPICEWEDDGQDSDDADIVRGGPNQSYSLKEARENFAKFGSMYRPSDTHSFERRKKLMPFAQRMHRAFWKAMQTKSEEDWKSALETRHEFFAELSRE